LRQVYGVEIVAFVTSVGKIHLASSPSAQQSSETDNDDVEDPLSPDFVELLSTITRQKVDTFTTRCPHPETSKKMTNRIIRAKDAMDSIGGTVTCVIRNSPVGLGEPVFDKFEAMLAHAMLSIPATKGFEIGSGFKGTEMPGSRHNDPYVARPDGTLGTSTNWSGGIQGGITNGENIYFRHVNADIGNIRTDACTGSALNLPRQFRKLREQHNMTDQPVRWPREDATIHALFREPFQLWKPWQPWF
jgi:chorismate synthase